MHRLFIETVPHMYPCERQQIADGALGRSSGALKGGKEKLH